MPALSFKIELLPHGSKNHLNDFIPDFVFPCKKYKHVDTPHRQKKEFEQYLPTPALTSY